MKRTVPVILTISIVLAIFGTSSSVIAQTIPTINITGVVPDERVTIETANFPANVDFDVRMGKIGTRGVDGFLVDTVNSGAGGTLAFIFDIPADLQGEALIAIRLESQSGYFSYNWFSNKPGGTSTPAPTTVPSITRTPAVPPSIVIPTISISSVVRDENVTIQTANFPANLKFDVRMGKIGTKGVGGELVTTIDSGPGGSFQKTFNIPSSLAGLDLISIRLENSTGYFSYNWFWNSSTTP